MLCPSLASGICKSECMTHAQTHGAVEETAAAAGGTAQAARPAAGAATAKPGAACAAANSIKRTFNIDPSMS